MIGPLVSLLSASTKLKVQARPFQRILPGQRFDVADRRLTQHGKPLAGHPHISIDAVPRICVRQGGKLKHLAVTWTVDPTILRRVGRGCRDVLDGALAQACDRRTYQRNVAVDTVPSAGVPDRQELEPLPGLPRSERIAVGTRVDRHPPIFTTKNRGAPRFQDVPRETASCQIWG